MQTVHILSTTTNTYDVLVADDVVFTKAALTGHRGPTKGKPVKAVATQAEAEQEETSK